MSLVAPEEVKSSLEKYCVPPISEFDYELGACWGIPRNINLRKSKNGKWFAVIDLIDSNYDLLPKKIAHIQVVAGQIQRNNPYYFAIAYLNEPDSYASFMSIEEITQDEYFDYMAENKVFTKT